MQSDMQLVLSAASFAASRHTAQRRKGAQASPYINHPLELASILAVEGGVTDSAVLAAALLHDTVEDTETTIKEIEARFGSSVAAIVAEVTEDKTLPKEERKRLQVVNAASKSDGAKLVKLADKVANLRDIRSDPPANWDMARKRQYFHWAAEVVAGLRGVSPALEHTFDKVFDEGPAARLELDDNTTPESSEPLAASRPLSTGLTPVEVPPAKIILYPDYDRNLELKCPMCGWEGTPKESGRIEYFRDLFDVSCPKCDKMLLIVGYPLLREN